MKTINMTTYCTNCMKETDDSNDIHCRKIFAQKITEMLDLGQLEEAEKLVAETNFKDGATKNWLDVFFEKKSRVVRQLHEQEVKKLEAKKIASICDKIDNKQPLDTNDLNYLADKGRFNELAKYHLQIFITTKDVWQLSLSSKYYRKNGDPYKAIEITNQIPEGDSKAVGAVFTSRGGAFRDTGDIVNAKLCVTKAIELNPTTHYAYTLLGAIYMEEMNFEDGLRCFKKAVELGASNGVGDREIKEIIMKSSADTRSSMIEYLLQMDPVKYSWVNKL